MFKKIICQKCGKKVNEKHRFCPHCGFTDRNFDDGNWGLLGKDDTLSTNQFPLPSGLNPIFNSLLKNLSKQLNNVYEESGKSPNKNMKSGGISISISTGMHPSKLKVKSSNNKQKSFKKMPEQFSKESSQKFAELPREEPKTSIRRLSDKVIYEIELQDVKSMKDVSIVHLENSIEVKAIGKNKAYFKSIPLNFPVVDYTLSNEKLILEFEIKN
jgi:ribosomal protein L37E